MKSDKEIQEAAFPACNPYELMVNRKLDGDYIRNDEVRKLIHDAFLVGAKWMQEQDNWTSVDDKLPDNGVEVLCFNKEWIDLDFNPNGTRVGFLNGSNEFTTAFWWDYQDTYVTVSKLYCDSDNEFFGEKIKNNTEPTHWHQLPTSPKF